MIRYDIIWQDAGDADDEETDWLNCHQLPLVSYVRTITANIVKLC